MRHRNAGRKFKRTPSHRKMLLRNLATSLLEHGRMETTLKEVKAKLHEIGLDLGMDVAAH